MSITRKLRAKDGIEVDGDATFNGTSHVQLPSGTTAQRPSPTAGMLRYNTTLGILEVYNGSSSSWEELKDYTGKSIAMALVFGG